MFEVYHMQTQNACAVVLCVSRRQYYAFYGRGAPLFC